MPMTKPYFTSALLERAAFHAAGSAASRVTFLLEGGFYVHLDDIVPSPAGTIEGHDQESGDLVSFSPEVVIGMQLGSSSADAGLGDLEALHEQREAAFTSLRAAVRAGNAEDATRYAAQIDELEAQAQPLFDRNAEIRGTEQGDGGVAEDGAVSARDPVRRAPRRPRAAERVTL